MKIDIGQLDSEHGADGFDLRTGEALFYGPGGGPKRYTLKEYRMKWPPPERDRRALNVVIDRLRSKADA